MGSWGGSDGGLKVSEMVDMWVGTVGVICLGLGLGFLLKWVALFETVDSEFKMSQ